VPLTYDYAAGVFGMNVRANTPEGVAGLPDGLLVLLLSGQRDPSAGSTPRTSPPWPGCSATAGCPSSSTCTPDARHEVFNETNRDEVVADLLGWIHTRLAG